MGKQGNRRPPRSLNSCKIDQGGTNGEESKYHQVEKFHEKVIEEVKKLDEFKDEMKQKFMEISLKMPKVDMGTIS